MLVWALQLSGPRPPRWGVCSRRPGDFKAQLTPTSLLSSDTILTSSFGFFLLVFIVLVFISREFHFPSCVKGRESGLRRRTHNPPPPPAPSRLTSEGRP